MVPWWLCATWRLSFALHVKQETSALWQAPGVDGFLSTPFTSLELMLAIRQIKSGMAQGIRQHPSRVSYPLWPKMSGMAQALRGFYSNCFSNLTKPKIWRKATVIAIPKFNTPTDDPKNYRLISLLCVPFKLLARLLLARLEPIIDPHSPDEQADFRRGRNTVHQIVTLLKTLRKPSKTATRQAWSWWTSQLNMTRYGTRALPWSYSWPSPCVVHLYYHLQPQLYTHDKRRTGRPIASTRKNGVPGAQSWLRYYLHLPQRSPFYLVIQLRIYADDVALLYFDRN